MRRHSGAACGSARRSLGNRSNSLGKATWASSRANGAPMQIWAPPPNATCGLCSRLTSNRSGLSNASGSRLAARRLKVRLWVALTGQPETSRSRDATRRVMSTGGS